MNYFDDDEDCTATEKMWVSYEAYQNRFNKKGKATPLLLTLQR